MNGQYVDFYPSTVTYDGWQLIVANLPAGLQFPMSVDFLDFLVISPTQTLSGDLYVSDLQALYSPRPLVTPPYVAIPHNPSWLQFTEDPATFRAGGTTLAALDDAHTHADDPNSTGSVVLKQDGAQIKALPPLADRRPPLQTMGDMSDTGSSGEPDVSEVAVGRHRPGPTTRASATTRSRRASIRRTRTGPACSARRTTATRRARRTSW